MGMTLSSNVTGAHGGVKTRSYSIFQRNGVRHPNTTLVVLVFTLPDSQKTTLRLPGEWRTKRPMTQRSRLDRGSTRLPRNSVLFVKRCGFSLFAVFFHLQEKKQKGLTYWFTCMFHVLDTKWNGIRCCRFWVGCFLGRPFHDRAFAEGVENTEATKLPVPKGQTEKDWVKFRGEKIGWPGKSIKSFWSAGVSGSLQGRWLVV